MDMYHHFYKLCNSNVDDVPVGKPSDVPNSSQGQDICVLRDMVHLCIATHDDWHHQLV